jgi:hypothetical protein
VLGLRSGRPLPAANTANAVADGGAANIVGASVRKGEVVAEDRRRPAGAFRPSPVAAHATVKDRTGNSAEQAVGARSGATPVGTRSPFRRRCVVVFRGIRRTTKLTAPVVDKDLDDGADLVVVADLRRGKDARRQKRAGLIVGQVNVDPVANARLPARCQWLPVAVRVRGRAGAGFRRLARRMSAAAAGADGGGLGAFQARAVHQQVSETPPYPFLQGLQLGKGQFQAPDAPGKGFQLPSVNVGALRPPHGLVAVALNVAVIRSVRVVVTVH